jgi:hypothetical protein
MRLWQGPLTLPPSDDGSLPLPDGEREGAGASSRKGEGAPRNAEGEMNQ